MICPSKRQRSILQTKRENSVRFRRGLDIWRSDRESAETGSIHQYLSGICSGRCISDVLQRKILRVCRIFYIRYRYFWIFSTVFTFLWNNCLVYAKEIFQPIADLSWVSRKFTVGISGQERNIIRTATKWKK